MTRLIAALLVLVALGLGGAYFWQAAPKTTSTIPDAVSPDGSRYYGPLVNGKRQGRGKVEWDNGDRYEGEFENGLFKGQGVYTTAAGDRYESQFDNGRPNGPGRYTGPTDESYEGHFKNGYFDGEGKLTYANGVYEGSFKFGRFSGQGKAQYKNGNSYRGQFERNQFHGKGRFQNAAGDVYEGDFVNDEFSGHGTYRLADKGRFEGEFLNWRANGPGTYTDAQGNLYAGNFVNGDLSGTGRYVGKNGTHYEGGFDDWTYDGHGVLTLPNGDIYTGEFDDGQYNGKGTLKYALPKEDGRTEDVGIWRYGSLEDKSAAQLRDANVEKALYNQNALLAKALDALAPSDPKKTELYLLAIAGDGTQEVFRREADFVQEQFDRDYGTRGRSMLLVNSRSSVDRAPLATMTSIRAALNGIAGRMDKQNDILFLYLTSHGSAKHEFSLQQSGMSFSDLQARQLGEMLKQTGIRHKVVVISACYAGGFIDPLKDDNTLIITAARYDRRSFGCSDSNDFTYFGRAYFKEALPNSASFSEAFTKAAAMVNEWENADQKKGGGVDHSYPQMVNPKPIEDYLKKWQAGLPPRLTPLAPPAPPKGGD